MRSPRPPRRPSTSSTMTEFANEVPMRVIGMLLGIPEADQPTVRERADAKLRTVPGEQMKVSQRALMDTDLFAEYIDWRADAPVGRPDDRTAQRGV